MIYWKHETLETTQPHWGFIYYRKLFLIFGLKKKIVFYLCDCSDRKNEKTFEFSMKISHFGICRLEFEKIVVIFEISTLEFYNMRKFMQKLKKLTFRKKDAYITLHKRHLGHLNFDVFGLEFKKPILIFEINALEFV